LKSRNKPIIGITMGDPKGIGPEVIRKALSRPSLRRRARFVIFGDERYFNWNNAKKLTPKDCGRLAGFYIEQAAHAVLTGQIDAVATAPISKEHLRAAGYPYPGHTEFLAYLARAHDVRMMMAGPNLKVVLATIHESIARVPSLLTIPSLVKTILITHEALQSWFGIRKPRIAVAALNPHAGESGMFGDEEKKIIAPAVQKARAHGAAVFGPFAPDTVFYRAVKGEFDAVVCMYHDQGLIPLKLLHFEEAVNITLGLPFIRTSVDHGTAFDIAGKGIANPMSMIAAIELAIELSQSERRKVSLRSER
jgi:4-hydroxythreonine-4-phosphate dehydrogenase